MPLDQIDVDNLPGEGGAAEMSFFDHLEELRWHIIRSLLAIVGCGIVVFVLGSWIFDYLIFWPKEASFPTYLALCQLNEATCFEPPPFRIISVALEEQFVTHIKVAAILGFIVSFPFVFWEFWRFVSPGLTPSERRYTRGVVLVCSFLFFLGTAFGYFVISPFAISFLAGYGNVSAQVAVSITLSSFVGSITLFVLPAGFLFELPVVVFFLSKIGVLTPGIMRAYRRHAVVAILLLAAIITPPDLTSQFFIGIPIYVLYELSIFVCARVVKDNEKRELQAYAD